MAKCLREQPDHFPPLLTSTSGTGFKIIAPRGHELLSLQGRAAGRSALAMAPSFSWARPFPFLKGIWAGWGSAGSCQLRGPSHGSRVTEGLSTARLAESTVSLRCPGQLTQPRLNSRCVSAGPGNEPRLHLCPRQAAAYQASHRGTAHGRSGRLGPGRSTQTYNPGLFCRQPRW